ncbi:MAG TPA: alkene reductase [Acidimicrobiales bacterium]|nr:alkene reductase [Acidimicrobiales bacterium]
MSVAFDPIELAGRRLANRIVMGPMTRNRAGADGVPTPAMATYYAQRASAGLIVTEGIQPSAVGQGYPATPGLHTPEQVDGWRAVTDAVHARGGTIYAQLMHSGRIGHPTLLPSGLWPVGPSAIAAAGQVYTTAGMQELVTPIELDETGIADTIDDFVVAARLAVDAGFDGVEIHGANGYLLHQFLSANANQRTDGWGGNITGRIRLTVEVTEAAVAAIGADRVGLRISPANPFNDIAEPDYDELYRELVAAVVPLDLAYLHVAETDRAHTLGLRRAWPGRLILNPASGPRPTGPDDLVAIDEGVADLISFGSLFLANPDLPARLAAGGPFNEPDRSTYYGGGERGYIDYPALEELPA